MHELNTNLPFNQRKNTIVYKAIGNYVYAIGNYVYTVKVSGFNDYTIIDKADLN